MGIYERYLKRILDIVCAILAMGVFCWLYGIIALLVRINLGAPVIFTQPRPGKKDENGREKIFKLYKFRTMTDERDEDGKLLPDKARLTAFGKKLRDTSLDELPETWNILRGDMSLIGPRPQLVRDMVFMTQEQRRRHDVRPGLSGLAQINGRNCIEWDDKLAYDIRYIKRISFSEDLRIALKTAVKVFRTEDISYGGMATAEDLGDYLLRSGRIDKDVYEERQHEAKELLKSI